VCSFVALNAFKSRAHLRNSTGSAVGIDPATALLPVSALPKISARPSDARPAITASRFTRVFLCCALYLHISRTPAEPHGVRRCRQNDHAARCSRTPRQLHLRTLDLLSSPFQPLACLALNRPEFDLIVRWHSHYTRTSPTCMRQRMYAQLMRPACCYLRKLMMSFLIFFDAFSDHACVFLRMSMHLEEELLTHEEIPTQCGKTTQEWMTRQYDQVSDTCMANRPNMRGNPTAHRTQPSLPTSHALAPCVRPPGFRAR